MRLGRVKVCWRVWEFESSGYIYVGERSADELDGFSLPSPLSAQQLRKATHNSWLYATGIWSTSDDKARFDAIGPNRGSCV